MIPHTCRSCGTVLRHTVVDLGATPLANRYLRADQLEIPEPRHSLHARVCSECFLVQVEAVVSPDEIFTDYAYFSSYSPAWLAHSEDLAKTLCSRFALGVGSSVLEVASNDGYLLHFFKALGLTVRGIEPAANVAEYAEQRGIPTDVRFFGREAGLELVAEGFEPDLVVGNNVLAHVPDLNDFVDGLKSVLKPGAILVMEFPHLLRLLEGVQFDTIYHEHFSYLSLLSVETLFSRHGLTIFDVEELGTHGGSLRIFAALSGSPAPAPHEGLLTVRRLEREAGLANLETYSEFGPAVREAQSALSQFLESSSVSGRSVVAYGAAAKGNTLLNSIDMSPGSIAYVVDKSPHKQGLFMPGSHLPILSPTEVFETKPDYLLILPWNWADEIRREMHTIEEWGGRFVVPIPITRVVE